MQEPESLQPESLKNVSASDLNSSLYNLSPELDQGLSPLRNQMIGQTLKGQGPVAGPSLAAPSAGASSPTVKSFAQQLVALDPGKDAARLALLNYLINFYEPNYLLNRKVFDSFFLQAMGFEFWRQNWQHLTEQVQFCVSQMTKKNRTYSGVLDWLDGEQMQPVIVSNQKNLNQLIYKHLEKDLDPAAQFKILKASDEYSLAVIFDSSQNLTVRIFSSVFVLSNAELVPASDQFQIAYDSQLNLKEKFYQHIPVGPHTSARFALTERGIVGRILRGYTFAKFEDLNGGAFSQYANAFFAFKKFESLYINLKTDPFYNEVVHSLEQATDSLNRGEQRSQYQAESILQRAKLAADRIFSDDKMLQLLMSNLEKTLSLKNLTELSNAYRDSNDSQIMDV
jgi:hypothetical protein